LIPPSVLMIVWGILTEQSIGQLFAAGVIPGLMMAGMFMLYILGRAVLTPSVVGAGNKPVPADVAAMADVEEISTGRFVQSLAGIGLLVVAVLGGIWFGIFTPTEAAGAGALIALGLALLRGMRTQDIIHSILSVGRTSAPILILLVTAALYSRTLAMPGMANAIESLFVGSGMPPWMLFAVMVLVWFLMGMIIDS